MSKRENKAAAAEFRELAGMDFDQFTRQAPVKVVIGLAGFAEPIDITVLQFADQTHPLFHSSSVRNCCAPCATPGSAKTWRLRHAGGRWRKSSGITGNESGTAGFTSPEFRQVREISTYDNREERIGLVVNQMAPGDSDG